MIIYSVQNPIDMCPTVWSFDDTINRFYNWKSQPILGITPLPLRDIRGQITIDNNPVDTIEARLYVDGALVTGASTIYKIQDIGAAEVYEYLIKPQAIPINFSFYVEILIQYADAELADDLIRSSCYSLDKGRSDCQLVKLSYSNTVNNRLIGGLLFNPDTFYTRHLYLKKYDSEVNVVDDETEADFTGNKVLIQKTHEEIDIFEVIDMPKKLYMGLIKISENDLVFVNGRRANITLEKAVESRIGIDEVSFINALMRVVYADDTGTLEISNEVEASFLALNSEGLLNIDSQSKLKIK